MRSASKLLAATFALALGSAWGFGSAVAAEHYMCGQQGGDVCQFEMCSEDETCRVYDCRDERCGYHGSYYWLPYCYSCEPD